MTDGIPWSGLTGGYGLPYDPRPALYRLGAGQDESAWKELWQELHHQGDVGTASYAAVPEMVRVRSEIQRPDWNLYALAATIDEARRNGSNPPMPDWLASEYNAAWTKLMSFALADLEHTTSTEFVDSIFAVLALGKGRLTLARMAMLTEDERQEMLDSADVG